MSPGVDFIDKHGDPAGIALWSVPIQGTQIAGAKNLIVPHVFQLFIFRWSLLQVGHGSDFVREASGLTEDMSHAFPQAAVGWLVPPVMNNSPGQAAQG